MEPLVLYDWPQLRRPILIAAFAGWNDAGQAATSAVRFIAGQLGAAKFAALDPEEFYDFTVVRPHVRLVPGAPSGVEWTTFELHGAVVSSGERDYIFGWGPEPHLKWKTFCATLLHVARECGVEQVVTVGAYLAEVLYTRPVPVTGFASEPDVLRRLNVTGTRYEGPTGIVGVLGEACGTAAVSYVGLWAALAHYIAAAPNPRGTLALLLQLVALLHLPIDLMPAQEEAAAFEQKVHDAVAKDPQLAAYVRELKKREFTN